MKRILRFFLFVCFAGSMQSSFAQTRAPQERPDVSNKALITKTAPPITTESKTSAADSAVLHKLAEDYYNWRNENYPVASSEAGLHTWDNRLTDYSAAKIAERAQHVRKLLDQVRAMKTDKWPKDDRINWLLFRAQLEEVDFGERILKFEQTNPLTYVGECSSAIFSLLKKEYDTPRNRALSAAARFKAMPAMFVEAEKNLQKPVKLYAQLAIQSARNIDPLFKESTAPLTKDLSEAERADFDKSRAGALAAIHGFADRLERKLPQMVDFAPMGEANYNYYLKHVLLKKKPVGSLS